MPRTKGAKDLSNSTKAQVLALKNVQEYSTRQIAKQLGVSQGSVQNITTESVSAEVRELAGQYEQDFQQLVRASAFKAVKNTFNKIDELPADRSAKVAETFFKMDRTIQERSTTKQQTMTEVEKYQYIFNEMIKSYRRDVVIQVLQKLFPNIEPPAIDAEFRVIEE